MKEFHTFLNNWWEEERPSAYFEHIYLWLKRDYNVIISDSIITMGRSTNKKDTALAIILMKEEAKNQGVLIFNYPE